MNEEGDRLLATADSKAFMQWQLLLEHQISTYWPYELDFLLASELWGESRNVLDVGCGNGHYLSYLRRFFPDKRFVGIDISAEHIAAGKANPFLEGIEFINADFANYRPAKLFDAVVMRLVLQHLDDLQTTLNAVRRLLKEDGTIIIIEPDPLALRNFPPTPKFDQLLFDYAISAAVATKTRAKLSNLDKQLSSLPNWQVQQHTPYLAPNVGPFSSTSLMQIYYLWIDIFESSEAVQTDFDAVREELDEWAADEKSFNRMGLQLFALRPVPGTG